jgi:hypothetical protein
LVGIIAIPIAIVLGFMVSDVVGFITMGIIFALVMFFLLKK